MTDAEPAARRDDQATLPGKKSFWNSIWGRIIGGVIVAVVTLLAFRLINGSPDSPSTASQESSSPASSAAPLNANGGRELVPAVQYTGPVVNDLPECTRLEATQFLDMTIAQQLHDLIPFLHSQRAASADKYSRAAASHDQPVVDPGAQTSGRLREAQESTNNISIDLATVSAKAVDPNSAAILLDGAYSPQSNMYKKLLPLVETFDDSLGSRLTGRKVVDASAAFTDGTFGDVHALGRPTYIAKFEDGDEWVVQRFRDEQTGFEQDRLIDVMAPGGPSYVQGPLSNWHP